MGRSRSAKNRGRKQRIAAAERRREQHVRLVLERSGDPRFPQCQVDPDTGAVSISVPEVHQRDVTAALAVLRQEFIDQFGRPLGPGDPLFFDRTSSTPVAAGEDEFEAALDEMAAASDDLMLRAQLQASKDVGYILTESNMHLFSAHEIDAWEDALDRRLYEQGTGSSNQ